MKELQPFWRKAIFENIPHGEEGSLQCTREEAIVLSELLLKKGYAVCLTGGDIGDEIAVHWLYAGTTENLDWADYGEVVFTKVAYVEDYPQAYNEDILEEDEKEE